MILGCYGIPEFWKCLRHMPLILMVNVVFVWGSSILPSSPPASTFSDGGIKSRYASI